MNKIQLQGILKDIEYSHTTNNIEFYKAHLLVTKENKKEDLLNIKFKRFSNPYKENDKISIIGNLRTFSEKRVDGTNKVEVYVFTYFDEPETEEIDLVELDGRLCKSNGLRKTKNGKDVIDFILANTIKNENGKDINCYIPCVAWGKQAKEIANLELNSNIEIKGQLVSREYKKNLSNNQIEIRVAHEVNINQVILSK